MAANLLAMFQFHGLSLDWPLFSILAAQSMFDGLRLGVAYLAIEPYARRRWAPQLISWQRLLAGRWNDPRVGRDVLLGLAGAAGGWVAYYAYQVLSRLNGGQLPVPVVRATSGDYLLLPVQELLRKFTSYLDGTLLICFLVFVLAAVLRKVWLWLPMIILASTVMIFSTLNINMYTLFFAMVYAVCITYCVRYGLLVSYVFFLGLELLGSPLVEGWGTWFWQAALWPWLLLLALTAYGLVVSVGGWRRLVWGEQAG